MLLLAQLIAPPLQPGPIRLPEPAPIQRSKPSQPGEKTPVIDTIPEDKDIPSTDPKPKDTTAPTNLPQVQGSQIYSPQQLRTIFATCGRRTQTETLQACAAALSARYVADGYVNTRVYVVTTPSPGHLDVVEGRLAEIRVDTPNDRFAARIRRLLRPLQGAVLNLPNLDRQILKLRRWPGIGSVQGSIGRLGSDPTLAILTLRVDKKSESIQGQVSLRNDGNAGNGQWRAVATVLKNDLMTDGDTLLVYGEGDMDDTPELGAVITSLSYSYPISESLRLTGSFGYSRRNLVEGSLAANQWSFRQFQGYGQLEWIFSETLSQRWYAFGGLSINRNDSYQAGVPEPLLNAFGDTTANTGFFRFGFGVNGIDDRSGWSVNLYGLQSANSFTMASQRENLNLLGINPGQASAMGASASLSYALSPNTSLNLRGAGQVAFNPLIPDLGFTLGSDTGLRGLPGQTISGDSGYLGAAEIAWTFWRQADQAVQLVPFVGYGGVSSTRYFNGTRFMFQNGIGAGGLLARFLAGQWQVEVGWVSQIDHLDQLDNAIWGNNYLIGNGLYTNVKYRF